MAKDITSDDLDLLEDLGVDTAPETQQGRTPREQRVIAGFEEIERFFQENGRAPQHGEDRDIFERIYAVRLDQIRQSPECRMLLAGNDQFGLLGHPVESATHLQEQPKDEELLAELGVEETSDVTNLVHVRTREEIRAAEEVAKRERCPDFDRFRPLFESAQEDLKAGRRLTMKYQDNAEVSQDDLFILDGHKILVAEVGEPFVSDYGRPDRRLRVIYDNGTESDLLLRSLQRALNKDKASRRLITPDLGPLFSGEAEDGDLAAGFIYVLRSLSDDPFIAENRTVIHKIGVTGSDVKTRIANARKDPTYLMADVEIVATYKLANINRKRIESLLHGFFSPARLDVELKDRFGSHVEPREWFLVPLPAVQEAIQKVIDETIDDFIYDPKAAQLLRAGN